MKALSLFFVSALFLAPIAQARDLTFKMECAAVNGESDPASDPIYQIVKTSSKDSGKWVNAFTLVVTPRSGTGSKTVFPLREASGDEGYLVYRATGEGSESFEWVTIGNKCAWGSFSTNDADYECEPIR